MSASEISLGIKSVGLKAELVQIKNLVNQIEWTNELPVVIKGGESYDARIYMKSAHYNHEPYKFMLVLEDEQFKEHKFVVQGQDLDYSIEHVQ